MPSSGREVVVLAHPVEEEYAGVRGWLIDGQSWSSLALALGASQRTVRRALNSLAAAGKVHSSGLGRAHRWMTPPVPGSRLYEQGSRRKEVILKGGKIEGRKSMPYNALTSSTLPNGLLRWKTTEKNLPSGRRPDQTVRRQDIFFRPPKLELTLRLDSVHIPIECEQTYNEQSSSNFFLAVRQLLPANSF